MELFLFFVSLFQKFNFSTLDGVKLSTEGVTGATRTPYPFKVYAKPRWTILNKSTEKANMNIVVLLWDGDYAFFYIIIIIYRILSFDYRLYIKDRPHTG